MPLFSPTSGLGILQSEIQSLRSSVQRKAENYEVSDVKSRLTTLEHQINELRANLDELSYQYGIVNERLIHFQQMEDNHE